jgi:iron complex transport system permease protein
VRAPGAALRACAVAALATLATRWLTVLPLGAAVAQALEPLARARLALFLLAAVMTAAAAVIGPLTFVACLGAAHRARSVYVTLSGPISASRLEQP